MIGLSAGAADLVVPAVVEMPVTLQLGATRTTIKALLEIPQGGECVLYLDSAGGSVYGALAVLSVLRIRRLKTTAVVLGECSSSTTPPACATSWTRAVKIFIPLVRRDSVTANW